MTLLPDAEWRERPGLRRIVVALSADGGAVKAVGGAVRDTLLGLPVADPIRGGDAFTALVDACLARGVR